jgi:hypothetical protein
MGEVDGDTVADGIAVGAIVLPGRGDLFPRWYIQLEALKGESLEKC